MCLGLIGDFHESRSPSRQLSVTLSFSLRFIKAGRRAARPGKGQSKRSKGAAPVVWRVLLAPIAGDVLFMESSNEPGGRALSVMPKRKPTSAGPMSVQPGAHGSTAATQLLMMPTPGTETKTPLSKKQSPRTEAVRIAKARILRRNSLRKQRQAQKD